MIPSPSHHLPRVTANPASEHVESFETRIRRIFRLIHLASLFAWAALEITVRFAVAPRARRTALQAIWLQRLCQRILQCLNLKAEFVGAPPEQGLLVCNHLSYLDIVVLGAQQPMAFVSKQDVRSWPVIGWLTERAGTIYINREQRSDVARVGAAITGKITQGLVVCIFPEGTSSGGEDVLPFRASLLQPAVEQHWTITPCHLRYELAEGSVADEVCYWRDMVFGPHLLNLLGKREIRARVSYGSPLKPEGDRKHLAANLRAHVRSLGGCTSSLVLSSEV